MVWASIVTVIGWILTLWSGAMYAFGYRSIAKMAGKGTVTPQYLQTMRWVMRLCLVAGLALLMVGSAARLTHP